MSRPAARLAALLALALGLAACAPAPGEPLHPAEPPAPTASPAPTAEPTPESTPEPTAESAADPDDPDGVDVDLTGLSSTLVFAQVASLTRSPQDYLGKTVRMQGQLAVYPANPALGIDYFYTVVIQDATACCQLGLEFVWEGGTLPEAGTELQVTGRYEAYDCGGLPSYHIVADRVETLS